MNDFAMNIFSHVLDVSKTDMKSLKELTLTWIKRLYGLLSANTDATRRKVCYRIDEETLDENFVEAEFPTFDIPPLKQMLMGEMSDKEKFKILSFLIDDMIGKEDIEKIPKEFMMQVIILMHLVKNDSMKPFEALAIAKTLRSEVPYILIYPLEVDIRAFRVSELYQTMFLILLSFLHSAGLKDFVSDFTLDNAIFQNNYIAMKNDNVINEYIFEAIMNIVNP